MSYLASPNGQATGVIQQKLHGLALHYGNDGSVVKATKPNTYAAPTSVSGHLSNQFTEYSYYTTQE